MFLNLWALLWNYSSYKNVKEWVMLLLLFLICRMPSRNVCIVKRDDCRHGTKAHFWYKFTYITWVKNYMLMSFFSSGIYLHSTLTIDERLSRICSVNCWSTFFWSSNFQSTKKVSFLKSLLLYVSRESLYVQEF